MGKVQDRFYERLGKMSKTRRLFFYGLVFMVVLGGWYYLFLGPKNKELSRLESKYVAESRKLEGYKLKARAYKKWERKMASVEEMFHAATDALPDKRELPALLKGISLAGSRAGLEFLLFQPDPEVDRDFYKEIPISLKVQGHYHQMAEFFIQVAQLNRIVSIKNLTMVRHPDRMEAIEMNCRAVTYMFSESSTAKKDGKKKRKKKKS